MTKPAPWLTLPSGAVELRACKYPDMPHMRQILWPAGQLQGCDVYFEHPGATCEHYSRGAVFSFLNHALWIHQPSRGHLAVAVFDLEGCYKNFYIHLCLPPQPLPGGGLSYVDMDLDVLVYPDRVEEWDRDEFEEHRLQYGYSDGLVNKTEQALIDLYADIEGKRFPFDGSVQEWIERWRIEHRGG